MAAEAEVNRVLGAGSSLVASDLFDDAEGDVWHQRSPLAKLGEGARWFAATPTSELEVCDLAVR
eukprot:2512570-Lingulodinium_polyedra.AAC.1